MKLIVGLGNPEKKYEYTRHNIGFMVLDNYLGNVNWSNKFNGLIYISNNIIYLKPLTYMNNSGLSVKEIVDYYNIDIDDILVIQDDLDQYFGKYKLKKNSSSGGHNGIKSIISSLHSESFSRLKIGINNEFKKDTIDFVLSKFSKSEMDKLSENYNIFNKIIKSFLEIGIDKTMNIYNIK